MNFEQNLTNFVQNCRLAQILRKKSAYRLIFDEMNFEKNKKKCVQNLNALEINAY